MRIGIDGHVLGKNIGGVERFVAELVQHLPQQAPQHQYIVFVTQKYYANLINHPTSLSVQYVPLVIAHPIIQRLLLMPFLVRKYALDALMIQRLSPWFCGKCKLVAVIHDLTPIKFSEQYKGLSNFLVRLLTKNTIKRASLILTPTNTIKAEIKQYYPAVKAPIDAFYNGVDVSTFASLAIKPTVNPIKTPYLLTVGAIEPRKNLETIFEMLVKLSAYPDLHLVVVGKVRDAHYDLMLKTQLAQLNLSHRVTWFGFIDEQQLIALYQHAALFISASKDEGFNIPPLEAFACGTPVICSDIAVHKELFTPSALFFNVESAADLAQKVNALLKESDLRHQHIQLGLAKVAEFTWKRTAVRVAASLERLI